MNAKSAMAKPALPLVPANFAVPEGTQGEGFRLRMLTIQDLARDYEAVVSSTEHLLALDPESDWPRGLTMEQNLVDLGWHQKEFQRRTSFTYTVVDDEDRRTLGCVYIYPSADPDCDAEVRFWTRQSELASGLESRLETHLRSWISSDWPFERVRYPGRGKD